MTGAKSGRVPWLAGVVTVTRARSRSFVDRQAVGPWPPGQARVIQVVV